jgi:lipopolysaccharide export system protein LptA
MDVYFSAAGTTEEAEIERAVAEGHVRVVQPGRRAQGEHAEYFAGQGKIVLTGGPPSLYDAEKGFTTGRRLTFFTQDDRLFVDGGDGLPSLSKHRVAQ